MTGSPPPLPPHEPWWRNARLWKVVIGVATVIGAIAAVLAVPAVGKSADVPSSGTSVESVTGDSGCVQVGGSNSRCLIAVRADEAADALAQARKLREDVARFSQGHPSGVAPWSFLVYQTVDARGVDIGLKVKREPIVEGVQVGSARSRSLVWGECFVVNQYNPVQDGEVDVGPKWLRIHWPADSPSSDFAESSPEDARRGYVYAGYVLPYRHDGTIPLCG